MTDRDRLAADLATTGLYEIEADFATAADRLIALGWTRLPEHILRPVGSNHHMRPVGGTLREAAQMLADWLDDGENCCLSCGMLDNKGHDPDCILPSLREALAQPPTGDRDALAADLIRFGAEEWLEYEDDPDLTWETFTADRLIAAGWTNPWGAALADIAIRAALDAGLADAAAGRTVPFPLDEERLARALDRVDPDYGPAEGRLLHTPSGQERQASLREWAAAIAKAYREDTDDRP